MAILDSDDYPEIRGVLDKQLTPTLVTDAFIAQPIFVTAADSDVLEIDPDAESRSGAEAERVRQAAIYFCAARLIIPLCGQIMSLYKGEHPYDCEKRRQELLAAAEDELTEVLEPEDATPNMPTMFTVATGTRGK